LSDITQYLCRSLVYSVFRISVRWKKISKKSGDLVESRHRHRRDGCIASNGNPTVQRVFMIPVSRLHPESHTEAVPYGVRAEGRRDRNATETQRIDQAQGHAAARSRATSL
jgi:hypothetical protein